MKVFLLILVAGERLLSLWNVIQKQIHTSHIHTQSENENVAVFKMNAKHRGTH